MCQKDFAANAASRETVVVGREQSTGGLRRIGIIFPYVGLKPVSAKGRPLVTTVMPD